MLDLRHQQNITLDPSFFLNKTSYHEIDLSNGKLEFLTPHLLKTLPSLMELRVDGNPKFQNRKVEAFLHSKSLEMFSCAGCGFLEIYNLSFTGLPSLERLDLSRNSIQTINKDAFNSNINLKFVNLTGNKLDLIRPEIFSSNEHLSVLDLSLNVNLTVREGTQLITNPNLTILYVAGCSFHVIDEQTFSGLPDLQEIYLQNNLIHKVAAGAFQLNPLLANLSFENNRLEHFPSSVITNYTKNLCLDQNLFRLTRGYVKLYSKYERRGLVKDDNRTICENRNETMKFEWLVMKYKVSKAGISNAFISTYLMSILLAEIVVVVLLGICLMKLKKKFKPEDLSQTILNNNSIYKICKND